MCIRDSIQAIYEAVGRMGFETGNILEPSMGVGNFFGMLPEEMRNSRLYGVELDPVSGRIAKQLYPKADITVGGFETTDRRDFFDLAIGNVPFGQYPVSYTHLDVYKRQVFPEAKYQRCTVHFYRNVFAVTPRSKAKLVTKMLKAIPVSYTHLIFSNSPPQLRRR